MKKNASYANWTPPDAGTDKKHAKLLANNARDTIDFKESNELKEFRGGKGVPKGPFGAKGKEF